MDVLVMLEEHPGRSTVLAHVNSVPSPLDSQRPARDVVTLYGVPTAESLALALAAAVESHRDVPGQPEAIRHLGVWSERGAIGDAAWRDGSSGELMTSDLSIPLETLHATAARLLGECGQIIHRLVAGLATPDWPEGARRAISVSLHPMFELTAAARTSVDSMLELLRETDGLTFDFEGD